MSRTCPTCAWFLLAALVIVSGAFAARAAESEFEPAAVEFFEKKVRPILVARCHECHAGEEAKGNLRLDSRTAALAGGDTGPAIVSGNADESLLIDAVRYGDLYQMPPDSQLPAAEIETLVEWVRLGAPWGAESAEPAGPAAQQFDLAARASHWSYQPLAKVQPPQVKAEQWIKTPVDRFVLAKLEAAGIEPAAAADRRSLLRRVTFDLTGLPPTPAEIEAFVNDPASGAYQRVVERLLASPHYGERWARHWLDLVRFAETQGHEFDFEIPAAYRYRDYLIRAFNADLPYDQFVVEHVAGDLLPTPRRNHQDGSNESIIATGWYFFGEAVHSPVDVRADEATRIDNQIDVFAKTFLGLTVSCARCHDHKFDAISTKDYYALAGYLQSSRYQQACIERPEAQQNTIVRLQALRAEQDAASREFARATLAAKLSQLAETLEQADAAAFDEPARTQPEHVLYPWTMLSQTGGDVSAKEFARRRVELAATLAARRAEESGPAARPLDFDGRGFSAWTSSGDAFTGGLIEPLEWTARRFQRAHTAAIGDGSHDAQRPRLGQAARSAAIANV